MLRWLRRTAGPEPGDAVRVTDGPYAGQTGVVTAVEPDGRRAVHIDECCRPLLAASQLERARMRDVGRAARESKLADADGEMVRIQMDSRDLGDGF
jgi:hypothetical protein